MWSRICTTWPEKPHCGNCGVPFMNSTTSFAFTSLSMNCSMPMESILFGGARRTFVVAGPAAVALRQDICNPDSGASPNCGENPFESGLLRGIKGPLHLADIVLIEPGNLENRARRVWRAGPELLLDLVHERAYPRHVGHIDRQSNAVGQARALRFRDQLHVQEGRADTRFIA